MQFETERLILRPWEISDARWLYEYAKHPSVGPSAGWPVHTSIVNSEDIIKNVLSEPETYALVLKECNHPIGSIGLMIGSKSGFHLPIEEAEIGYWLGVPHWGKGLMPEALDKIIEHAFDDLLLHKLWCGYFDGNNKSMRVQEKCGFTYHHVIRNLYWQLINKNITEHVTCLTKEDYYTKKAERT